MKGVPNRYSAAELAWLKARATWPRRALLAAFRAAFGRDDVSLTALNGLCKRKGWMTGRSGRFEAGHVPVNKGRKGVCAPGSETGWFRPGVRRGRAARLYQPIGTQRLSQDGYVERKIHDGLPMRARWRAVHRIRWEAVHGPVPDGHCLKCRDGDKTNTDPANWLAIPRALLPRLNGRWTGLSYDAAEPELKPCILAAAKLHHAARKAARKAGKASD